MSNKVRVLMKKYGPEGTHLQAREAALAKLAVPRAIPDPGEPAYTPEPPKAEAPQVAEPAEEKAAKPVAETTAAGSEETSDSSAEPSAEAAPEEVVADQAAAEEAPADAEEKSE